MRLLLALCLLSAVVLGGCASRRSARTVHTAQRMAPARTYYAPVAASSRGEIIWESEPYTLDAPVIRSRPVVASAQPTVVERTPIVRAAARPAPAVTPVRTAAFAPPPAPSLPADCAVMPAPSRTVYRPAVRRAVVRPLSAPAMRACVPAPVCPPVCPPAPACDPCAGGNCGVPSLDDSCPGGNCGIPALDFDPCKR